MKNISWIPFVLCAIAFRQEAPKLPENWKIAVDDTSHADLLKQEVIGGDDLRLWSSPTLLSNGDIAFAAREGMIGVLRKGSHKLDIIKIAGTESGKRAEHMYVRLTELSPGQVLVAMKPNAITLKIPPHTDGAVTTVTSDSTLKAADEQEFIANPVKFRGEWTLVDTSGAIQTLKGQPIATVPSQIMSTPVVMEDGSLFLAGNGGFFRVRPSGDVQKITDLKELRKEWKKNNKDVRWPQGITSTPVILNSGTIAAGADTLFAKDGRMFFFDKTGKPLSHSFGVPGGIEARPLPLKNGNLFFATLGKNDGANGVYFLSPDGKELSHYPSESEPNADFTLHYASPIQLNNGTILVCGGRGFYLFSDAGKFLGEFSLPGGTSMAPSPIQLPDGSIAFIGNGHFFLIATGHPGEAAPRHVTDAGKAHR
ncbi:MAG: hypothetical protein HYR96_06490 [Deltaproteobacteria bacterium]|nr:hypothetical protein [Deltaproteobacteria bacterium]